MKTADEVTRAIVDAVKDSGATDVEVADDTIGKTLRELLRTNEIEDFIIFATMGDVNGVDSCNFRVRINDQWINCNPRFR